MKLPILDLSQYTHKQQGKKILEEINELRLAETQEHKLEEALDIIQSVIGYLRMIATDEELMKAMDKHRQKLEGRGHKILGYLEVSYEPSEKTTETA